MEKKFKHKKTGVEAVYIVTEDKVEIFEIGGKIQFVSDKFVHGSICNITKGTYEDFKNRNCKFFSTLEKAEEYIKWNKPMYSLNDVKEALFDSVNEGHVLDVLEKLGRK